MGLETVLAIFQLLIAFVLMPRPFNNSGTGSHQVAFFMAISSLEQAKAPPFPGSNPRHGAFTCKLHIKLRPSPRLYISQEHESI